MRPLWNVWPDMRTERGPGWGGEDGLDVRHDLPFKALHNDGGQCHRAIVTDAGWSRFLWHRYDDGGLEM